MWEQKCYLLLLFLLLLLLLKLLLLLFFLLLLSSRLTSSSKFLSLLGLTPGWALAGSPVSDENLWFFVRDFGKECKNSADT